MTVRDWLVRATQQLIAASETPRLDAEVLLAAVLQRPRSYLFTWPERLLHQDEITRLDAWLMRRSAGEPIAYLMGQRAFWSFDVKVTPDTLIPRPETELLVELALARVPIGQPVRIADLGTGSGAIALAIALERPDAHVIATDCSTAALHVAVQNAQRLGLQRVDFRHGDWCAALNGEHFDVIVSNPPYIAATYPALATTLRYEPYGALAAGADGLDALRQIIDQAPAHLNTQGWLLLEHGYDQGAAVPALLQARGFVAISDHADAGGVSRVSVGRY